MEEIEKISVTIKKVAYVEKDLNFFYNIQFIIDTVETILLLYACDFIRILVRS